MKRSVFIFEIMSLVILALSLDSFADNQWIRTGPHGGRVRILVINPQAPGTLYAGTYYGGVFKIQQQTIPPEAYRFELMWGSPGTGNGQFRSPEGVAVDSLGYVYVTDTYNHRVQKFSPTTLSMILKSPSPGEHFNTCSLDSPPTFSWDATETFADFETQLSADWNFTVISFKVKVSAPATQITIPSDTWEEIMMFPSASAGTIYWRVIGTRADGTTETSAVRSFFVRVEPAGDLSISPVSKRTKPTLTWQTNCNTRLKVWFGSDTNFNKKASYSFEIANPSDLKTLTPGQWIRIKMLVKNKTGSTIYWYVESWDALGRYAKTDVMSFVLTE